MRGKLIVIEGNDCSGKETQAKLLEKKMNEKGFKAKHLSFPNYETPTGKIIGTCFLGKDGDGWFKEGASHVDSYVSSLYYAADRKYNILKIYELLNQGFYVILDRYTFSNMAHQGGKIVSQEDRFSFFKRIEVLEFDLLELPKPDLVILLYVPYQVTLTLLTNRGTLLDENEQDKKYLKRAEQTYLELKALYHFKMIECTNDYQMRSIDSISDELELKVMEFINEEK